MRWHGSSLKIDGSFVQSQRVSVKHENSDVQAGIDIVIKALEPDAAAPGLHLVIQPKGAKSWAVRFRGTDGEHVKVTLGPVDLSGATGGTPIRGRPMTLAGARRLAAELMHARESGQHVVARKRRRGSTDTFAEAARAFVEEYARPRNRRWKETAKRLGLEPDTLELRPGGLAALWKNRRVVDITPEDIDTLIRDVKRRGVPGLNGRGSPHQARGQLRCLSKMFSWLRPHVTTNPCRDLDMPPAAKARERVLTDAEVTAVWHASAALAAPFDALVKVLLLTGARRDEVAKMERSELVGDRWTIPGERTKNHRAHTLPLPPLAVEILASVTPVSPHFVFSTNRRTAVSGFSKLKRRLDREMASATSPPGGCMTCGGRRRRAWSRSESYRTLSRPC